MTTPGPAPLPEFCAVAFKEWAGICAAVAEGRQALILRKGGIAEGPRGFEPEQRVFWLYPTHVHEAEQGLRDGGPARIGAVPPSPNTVRLQILVAVETIPFVDRPEPLAAIADQHVWTDETIQKRFQYRRPGLWVLGVRAYQRPSPYEVAVTPEHAGCKTWVPLDEPLSTAGVVPVLDDEEFARRMDRLRAALEHEESRAAGRGEAP